MYILASDFDETLKRGGTVSREDIRTIQKVREEGNIFGIVTARSYDMLKAALWFYRIPYDFLILINGGMILDKDKNVLFESYIEDAGAFQILQEVKKREVNIAGVSDGIHFSIVKHKNDFANSMKALGLNLIATPVNRLKGFASFFFESEREVTEELYELFKDKSSVSCVRNVDSIVDLSAYGVDKAHALTFLKEYYGIEKVYVIGDSRNDLQMIETHIGIAIENAEAEVKEKARVTVRNFAECKRWIDFERKQTDLEK